MLVQDRPAPKPSIRKSQPPDRQAAKTLADISSFASDHLSRILIALLLLFSAAAAALLLPSAGETAALLCFSSAASSRSAIPFPAISWSNIPPLPPPPLSSPPPPPSPPAPPFPAISWSNIPPLPPSHLSSLRATRWIVAAAPSSAPSAALRRLSRLPNWQLLLVATSSTPLDFSLKGAVFLPLDLRSALNFRTIAHLPFNSHTRKSLGYLFAIQHGARIIYDADDRAEILDGLAQFDLDIPTHETILQYSHADPNRTVVNPFVHFGQRSIWPRGLPLESISNLAREEFYTEVYSGRQFIQQGLSNGLPDVDSVFYFTRKSSALEVFDIRFDGDAPKVALPQGTMAPVNSFNTLFHTQAFWGLMLPVSVSSMASDVIRGYWAQRILWEIGGYVAFYPPTIHRTDRAEGCPFAEEKDLHVNVGRLIKFLVSWRSNKLTLFERILHLSYAMAEEGFWSELDVRFTAAWLQDLIAVGYQQPRLMSLELDRPRATIGHGDRREFVPKKFPSVHLGVEEVGTVNLEIGKLIRWRKNFGNVVLIMYCSGPVERTALEWRLLYGRIFKTVIILSEHTNSDLAVDYGQLWQAYKFLPKVFDRYKGAEGFLFLQDDMVLNYWNLLQADKTKLWITNKAPQSWVSVPIDGNNSEWFVKQAALVKKIVGRFPVHLQVGYKEAAGEDKLTICGSEIFFVPRRFVGDFVDLVGIVGDLEIHHKVAVPMFFMAIGSPRGFDSEALSTVLYSAKESSSVSNATSVVRYYNDKATAVSPVTIQSESDFIKLVRVMASGDPLLLELV